MSRQRDISCGRELHKWRHFKRTEFEMSPISHTCSCVFLHLADVQWILTPQLSLMLYFLFRFAIAANDLWSQISAVLATFFAMERHEKVLYTRNFAMWPLSDAISVFATAIMLYTPDPCWEIQVTEQWIIYRLIGAFKTCEWASLWHSYKHLASDW